MAFVSTGSPTPSPTLLLQALVIDSEEGLNPYIAAWDSLAIACERPFCAPAWMLAWWREGRSGDARLRVALALEGDRLVGIAPFFAQVSYGLNELRLLSAGFSHRIGLLAEAGRQEEVAASLAPALAASEPAPASVVFEGIDAEDPWPDLLTAAWPARGGRLRTDAEMKAPVVELEGSYEDWMEGRPRKFRKEARRNARRLEEEGVQSRISTQPDAVAALLHLHEARWQDRGGSDVGARAERVVAAAAAELGPSGRLEVALLEDDSQPIAGELLLRAGEVAAFWAGGFDPTWSRFAPGTQTMLAALRAAADGGVRLVDLGGGAHPYKLRMADASRPLVWRTLFPRGWRYPLIRLRLAPKHLKQAARRIAGRLPEPAQRQLERMRGRR